MFSFLWRSYNQKNWETILPAVTAELRRLRSILPPRVRAALKKSSSMRVISSPAGQVLARMDTQQLEAQRREAEAQLQQARYAVETAKSQVKQRLSEKDAALAVAGPAQGRTRGMRKRLERSEILSKKGVTSIQKLDDNRARFLSGQAAVSAAAAQVAAAEAAITTAKSQLLGAVPW